MTSCLSNLNITGFDTSFWAWSEILGCNDTHTKLKAGNEMCSNSKTLTLNLTRTSTTDTGFKFSGVITVKKHPRWQTISQEKSELRGLAFIKGVTYFVAAIDSLAGIMAAILASMFRNPRSFWKSWAESVNVPEKCEAVHYEDSCTAVTSSNSKIEEVMEVKSY
uniref:Uncharacterized protein n=1 Tax=Arion vulgaris TaxID=1028688 RepID=A0A0B6YIA6_9EUPU